MESNDSKQEMQSQSAVLCKAGCGFYGSSSSDGYCSVCFKKKLQRHLLLSDGISTATSSSLSSNPSSDSSQESGNESEGATIVQTSNNDVSTSPDQVSQTTTNPSEVSSASTEEAIRPKNNEEASEELFREPLDLRKKCPEISMEEQDDKVNEGESSKKKNRCFVCKKKVGLTGFGCRCGGLFCGLHRYSDTHDCNYDYKEQGQLEIRKNNPKVTFQKVAKI